MYKERKLIKVCIINFLLMIYRLITIIRCILCFEVYLEQNFSKDNINNYSLVVFKKKPYTHKNWFGLFYVSHNFSFQYVGISLTIQKSRSPFLDKR